MFVMGMHVEVTFSWILQISLVIDQMNKFFDRYLNQSYTRDKNETITE